MKIRHLALFLACCIATAQDKPEKLTAANASISGVVKDAVTGKPLRDYVVSTTIDATWVNDAILMSSSSRDVKSITDEQGHYRLADLPAGKYRVRAQNQQSFGSAITRSVTLGGQDVENIDFSFQIDALISGKVVDENKEPVPDAFVILVAREYFQGQQGYFFRKLARTSDRGNYQMPNVPAGHPFLLMVEKRERRLPTFAETPLNPKLRRRVATRAWYPNSPDKDGAAVIMLTSGERREGIDIQMRKAANFCIEGMLQSPTGPGALNFQVDALQPSSGISSGGGMFVAAPQGTTAPDGKFRVCDLGPGVYRITAAERGEPGKVPAFGAADVNITDRDVSNFRLSVSQGIPVAGEVAWDGALPDKPIDKQITVSLSPLIRAPFQGEQNSAKSDVPGTFSLKSLLIDDYDVRTFFNVPGLYVKDILYGGRSVKYEPMRVGGALAGAGLRVTIAADGGTISARVTDKDGNPVSDSKVVLIPADVASEGIMAARMVSGSTDQMGHYQTSTMAPGKYYVAAMDERPDPTPESIDRLWRSRTRFQEVDLAPSGSAQVTLQPIQLQ